MIIQSVGQRKWKPLVPPANANEVPAAKVLNRDDHVYLKQIWSKFHDSINKLNRNDIISDINNNNNSNLSNYEEKISNIDHYVSQKKIMIRSQSQFNKIQNE